eukprot:TRINITY_DN1045_c0_g1_i2.p1 TRINITY_DN1045_c0_g1~~TRINITY_DN1045_c0_g1_i2.p1  ORF type:complete len:307 (+),score=87.92 TRINITY_DN1045_c0_g1_i2:65-985(+)
MKDFLKKGKGKRESEDVGSEGEKEHSASTTENIKKKKLKEEKDTVEEEVDNSENESDNEDEEEESSSDYVSSNSEEDEEIEVSFEVKDPKEIDFHAIKNFVGMLVQGDNAEELTPSPLADLIIAQTDYVGSVVKIDDNEETFGIISVVNMHKHSSLPTIQNLQKHLLTKADTSRDKLESIFEDKSKLLGLIINDRMLNVPPQLSYPLNSSLFQEIEWAKEYEIENNQKAKGDKKGKGKSIAPAESDWNFSHYLYITSYYVNSKRKQWYQRRVRGRRARARESLRMWVVRVRRNTALVLLRTSRRRN